MLLDMSIEICLLTETSITSMTTEWSFFIVNIPNVTLKVRADREGSFTVLALVRLFASVCSKMTGEIGRSREHLGAELARIPILADAVLDGGEMMMTIVTSREKGRRRR